jgi:hypothetical protein
VAAAIPEVLTEDIEMTAIAKAMRARNLVRRLVFTFVLL